MVLRRVFHEIDWFFLGFLNWPEVCLILEIFPKNSNQSSLFFSFFFFFFFGGIPSTNGLKCNQRFFDTQFWNWRLLEKFDNNTGSTSQHSKKKKGKNSSLCGTKPSNFLRNPNGRLPFKKSDNNMPTTLVQTRNRYNNKKILSSNVGT